MIVESVVRIANALRIGVTAEGVETEAEWKIVRKLGCESCKGTYSVHHLPCGILSILWNSVPRCRPLSRRL